MPSFLKEPSFHGSQFHLAAEQLRIHTVVADLTLLGKKEKKNKRRASVSQKKVGTTFIFVTKMFCSSPLPLGETERRGM